MKKTTCRFMTFLLSFTLMFSGIGFFGFADVFATEEPASDLVAAQEPEEAEVDRQVFIDSAKLSELAAAGAVVAEVSWGPAAPEKLIKGAIHVDTDDLESNAKDDGYELWDLRDSQNGYKKLMDTLATKYGITKDSTLVCYGASGSDSAATRLAMAALMLGVKSVKVLDGGFEAWKGETAAAAAPSPKESFGAAAAHPEWVLSTDDLVKNAGTDALQLVSIRSYDEFIGKNSGYAYIDKAGEPKGAIWGHDTDDGSYLHSDGTVINYDEMVNLIKSYDSGFNPDAAQVAFYCGTGWRATIPFLIAYQAGKDNMRLWDDGWYVYCGAYADEWNWAEGGGDPAAKKPVGDYPVQVGDPKKGNVTYTTTSKLEPIYNPLRALEVKEAVVTVAPGKTADINFDIKPPKKGITNSLTFASSNTKAAKVDAEGKVTVSKTAKAGTELTITATGNAVSGSTPDKEGTHKEASYKLIVGGKAKVSGSTYKLLSGADKTAAFVKAKNAKSVSVPASVKINGKKYKVTKIGPKAFTAKKIRTVTIGANVETIAKNAFKGSKASKMILKTKKLTKKSVKGSLKGSKIKTAQVKAGSKKVNKKLVKAYKKYFTKKNAGKKASVK